MLIVMFLLIYIGHLRIENIMNRVNQFFGLRYARDKAGKMGMRSGISNIVDSGKGAEESWNICGEECGNYPCQYPAEVRAYGGCHELKIGPILDNELVIDAYIRYALQLAKEEELHRNNKTESTVLAYINGLTGISL
jgi:hypothetical protein